MTFLEALAEEVFDVMNGNICQQDSAIPIRFPIRDEFQQGSTCCAIYEDIGNAKNRICEQLREEENADAETIMNGWSCICRTLAVRMFLYGYQWRSQSEIKP